MAQRIPLTERFWAKVDKNGQIPVSRPDLGPCWQWTARLTGGYGRLWCDGKQLLAHTLSYRMLRGEIPNGMDIDHLCRNRGCVNPDHMEPVTERENTLRGIGPSAQNATKTHCKRGHPLDETNTKVINRHRVCKTCNRERCKLFERQKRARKKREHSSN
jgi:hypothetical protein